MSMSLWKRRWRSDMCCLFGLIDTRHTLSGKDKSKILHILASESEARGTGATGIAYNLGNRLYIHKRPVPGHRLQIWVRDDTATVMGHTRMTTQGRASRNRNNHPFFGMAGNTPFALAHNGVLYNDSRLRSTRACRRPGSRRTAMWRSSYWNSARPSTLTAFAIWLNRSRALLPLPYWMVLRTSSSSKGTAPCACTGFQSWESISIIPLRKS